MKKLLPLLFVFITATAYGQGIPSEYNWCFGSNAGVSFSSGSPVAFSSAVNTDEGSASVSNSAGNLLLQAYGNAVYNGANNLISNGAGLMGSSISAQSNLFILDPGNANRYYLFTVSNWTDINPSLRYSVIDLTQGGGAGAILPGQKNILLGANTREQLTATRHSNGVDWWIMSHRFGNNEFTAYLLTAAGISTTPVVSAVGMTYAGFNRYGSMKFSYGCQKKLISVLGGGSPTPERAQLFDFDTNTGIVSNPVTIATNTTIPDAYSAEFSPDNSRLYITAYNTWAINQYNLTVPNIAGSRLLIGNTSPGIKSWVQLGPDNKIYVARAYSNWLGRLNEPNLLGAAADYEHNAVNLGTGWAELALPNFPNSINSAPAIDAGAPVSFCSGASGQLQPPGTPLPGVTYVWSPATGLSNPSVFNPMVTLTNTSNLPVSHTYTLTATSNGCSSTGVVEVTVNPSPAVDAGAPISFCNGASGQLQPQGTPLPGVTYVWSPATGLSNPNAFNPTVTLANTSNLPITVTYTLTATGNGCSGSDEVTVTVTPNTVINAGAPVTICSGATGQLEPTGALPGYTYAWSPATGLSDPTVLNPTVTLTNSTNLPNTVTYTLTATSGACSGTSSVNVTVWPNPAAAAGPDRAICSGATTTLGTGPVAGNTYSWSPAAGLSNPLAANPQLQVTHAGLSDSVFTYSLTVTNAAGCETASQVQVTVTPSPQVNAGMPVSVCSGAATPLLPQNQQTGYSYVWSPATGLSDSTVFSPTVTLVNTSNLPVSQTYTLTATNNGCSSSDVVEVTVNPIPTGILGGVVSLCPPRFPGDLNPVGYMFTGAGGATAGNWGVNGGGTIVQQIGTDSITVQWGASNPNASVWVIPTNSFGCPGDIITLPVEVRQSKQTAMPTGPTSVCSNSLNNQTYSAGPLTGSYHWFISGGQIVSGNNTNQIQVNWQLPGPGMLTVNQQFNHGDTCFLYSDTLFVNLLPAPAPISAVNGNTVVCAGNSATYTLVGSATATYQWQAQGGQITSGQGSTAVEVQWNSPGNNSISVQEIGGNGCASTAFILPVNVQGTAPAVVSAPIGFCAGGPTELTYQVQGLAGSSFQWQAQGGQIQTGQGTGQVTVTWDSTATAHNLSVTETSGNGCVSPEITIPVTFDNSQLRLVSVTVDTTNESQVLVHYQVANAQNNPQTEIEIQRQQPTGNYLSAGNSGVNQTTFTDAGLQTGQQAFYYRLQGQNLCAEELLSNEHATVWLQGQAQPQSGLILLQWTPYVGWGNQEIQYQIWRRLSNETSFHLLPALTTSQTSIQAELGQDGLTQCFRIMALAADTRQSWSNSICLFVESPLVVPNIITPNGDGKNDVFLINKLHLYPNSELIIMNRWGKQVYQSSNYQNNWGANNLPDGVYYYQLNVPNKPAMKGWLEVMK